MSKQIERALDGRSDATSGGRSLDDDAMDPLSTLLFTPEGARDQRTTSTGRAS